MRIHQRTAASIAAAVQSGMDGFRAEPPMNLSDWADKNFKMAGESSQQKGAWESWPFQVGIMDFMSDDRIEELDFMKSKRVGYALALDTPLPTPSGWTTMGEINAGDLVFDENGKPCSVRYCSPIYKDHECFKITFCDGTSVVADKGHRWMVEADTSFEYLLNQRGSGRVGRPKPGQAITKKGILDTGQIAKIYSGDWPFNKLRIANTLALDLPDADLPIPPYTLGLWLGDGNTGSPRITQHRTDVETAQYIEAEGIKTSVRYIDARYPNNATIFLDIPQSGRPTSPWAKEFRALGLCEKKYVPSIYMRASINQRLELLRGLMDSDGTVSLEGRCEFNNTNHELAVSVYELIVSLGLKASLRMRPKKYQHHLDQYRVNFKATKEINPFNLQRKSSMVKDAARPSITLCRRIISVTPIDPQPVRCIEVDSESHLFLCTRAMIPTHNTKMITAMIAYTIGHLRRNQAIWQPTDDDRDSYVKSEIDPVLDMIDAVAKAKKKSKGHQDTIKLKQYTNSALHMLGGKASRAYRRITVALAILDEWDAFDQSIEKAGDPGGLAKGRLEGAPHPKFIGGTTPRLKGLSHVERACDNAEGMVRYHIDCPHCGVDHPLSWGGPDKAYGFKWTRGQHDTVHHICPHCHASITQADYLKGGQPLTGVWVCEKTGKRYGTDRVWRDHMGMPCRPPRTLGAHIWAAYSPQRSWPSIVKEFEEALVVMERGDVGPMQLFVNETRGETWEMAGERSDHHELQQRAEDYPLGTVPVGGLVLTCGIDVQRTWWQLTVYAWGRGLESWVVDCIKIDGNPANDEDWELLTPHLQKRWPQAWHGGSIGLSATSIDSSDQTQAVYNWVDKMQSHLPNLRAIKGSSIEHDAILCAPTLQDIDHKGRKKKKGVKLWKIGVDTAKDLLLGQLGIAPPVAGEPRPGYIHFSNELPREYYEQLTAEQRILAKVAGKDTYRWVKRRPRNEETDIRNYALHAAYGLGLHKHTDQKWAQIEQAVQPAADLFSTIAPVPAHALALGQIQISQPRTQQKRTVQTASVPPTPAAPFASPFASNEWSSRL